MLDAPPIPPFYPLFVLHDGAAAGRQPPPRAFRALRSGLEESVAHCAPSPIFAWFPPVGAVEKKRLTVEGTKRGIDNGFAATSTTSARANR